jgi:stress-induced morphogen
MLRRAVRLVSRTGGPDGTPAELAMRVKLEDRLGASYVQIQDTSGGCGSFYSVQVVSSVFSGHKLLEQHRMVKEVLSQEIAACHGVTIFTKCPPQ